MEDITMSDAPQIKTGDKVLVRGRHVGTVKWGPGTLKGREKQGLFVGVQLEVARGENNGSHNAQQLFQCGQNYGTFAPLAHVEHWTSQSAAAVKVQSFFRTSLGKKKFLSELHAHTWNMLDNHEELLMLKRGMKLKNAEKTLSPLASKKMTAKPSSPDADDFIETDYNGPHITFPLTLENVVDMLEQFKQGKTLHYVYAKELLEKVRKAETKKPTLQDIVVNGDEKITIVGDLHGQLQDIFSIFTINGLPTEKNQYLFNGDFVDRGDNGAEVYLTICSFMLLYPQAVFVNRGNHESRSQNSWMGFEEEVLVKYDGTAAGDPMRASKMLECFHNCFDALPLCAVVQEKIFVVHGGLFARDGVQLSHLKAINRKREPPLHNPGFEDQVFEDMLWSDPRPIMGRQPSERGAGVEFGQDVTNNFCAVNGIALIVRSHECVQEGFEVLHGGRLITLFSASRYCGTQTNKGAFLTLGPDLQPEIQQFYAHSMQQTDFGISTPAAKKNSDTKAQDEKLERDNIRLIVERIVDCKPSLYWYFTQHDVSRTGKVSRLVWADALRSVLQVEIPFLSYQKKLAQLEEDGTVNYTRFLERYQIQMSVDNEEWQNAVVEKICVKLFRAVGAGNLQDAFKVFDTDEDGTIQYDEFVSILKTLDIGLSDQQMYELMRSADTNLDGKVDFKEFVSRFELVFTDVQSTADKMDTDDDKDKGRKRRGSLNNGSSRKANMKVKQLDPATQQAVTKIGANIIRRNEDFEAAFRSYDSNQDGVLSYAEFATAVADMKIGVSEEEARKIAETLDDDKNGALEYKEFVHGFRIVDKKDEAAAENDEPTWQHSLLQQVANVLFQHRIHMRAAFRMFDVDNSGTVCIEEFQQGLQTINRLLDEPLSNVQIEELMKALDKNGDGQLSYKEFLEGFRVIDTQTDVDLEKEHNSKQK